MRAVDIIAQKRDGSELTSQEIEWFINQYSHDQLPDYQAAAWLMAVLLKGMTHREAHDLTIAMANSGDVLDLSDIFPRAIDKHSSGGVGDKTSLVVLPLVAACGIPVAKMSGRGLGFSGGTLDKMEAIPGYRVTLTPDEFRAQARQYGIVLAGQSLNLTPADSKLYALRDVTATVPSLPLIASSIMSKKIAAGAHGIVLDVKVGRGAFMNTLPEARELAELMVAIGKAAGRDVIALLSGMDQPLGEAVGNSLEVQEAITALQGGGPADLREHCLTTAGQMIRLFHYPQTDISLEAAIAEAETHLNDGSAFEKFRVLVQAQGGDVSYVDQPDRFPKAAYIVPIAATESGWIAQVDALTVAMAALDLGAGREKKSDSVDHAVGIIVHKKVGDPVQVGENILTIHANDLAKLAQAQTRLSSAITYSPITVSPLPAFYDTIDGTRR